MIRWLVVFGMWLASVQAVAQDQTLLPVVSCQTSRAIPDEQVSGAPQSLLVSLPKALADRLAFYSDQSALIVLGPRGWGCSAQVGADNSQRLEIRPVGSPAGPTATKGPAVFAYHSGGGCVGCAAQVACSFFPERVAAASKDFNCKPPAPPKGETLVRPDVLSALVSDPPHVKGTSWLSGEAEPSTTLIEISPPGEDFWAAKLDCTLSVEQAPFCSAIVKDFDARQKALTAALRAR